MPWYSGLVLGYASLGSQGSNPRYSLTTFHSLISPLSDQRLPKLLSYSSETKFTMLYASEAVVAVNLARYQYIQERS